MNSATTKSRRRSSALLRHSRLEWKSRACLTGACATSLLFGIATAAAQNVRLTNLSDVAFSTVALGVDSVRAQSVCAFSSSATRGYNIKASGSGANSDFTLSNGASLLSYEVQWAATSGQPNGTPLIKNVPLNGLTSTATQQQCNSGPASSASLIVIIRSDAASSATAGSYSGNLTLVIAPE